MFFTQPFLLIAILFSCLYYCKSFLTPLTSCSPTIQTPPKASMKILPPDCKQPKAFYCTKKEIRTSHCICKDLCELTYFSLKPWASFQSPTCLMSSDIYFILLLPSTSQVHFCCRICAHLFFTEQTLMYCLLPDFATMSASQRGFSWHIIKSNFLTQVTLSDGSVLFPS